MTESQGITVVVKADDLRAAGVQGVYLPTASSMPDRLPALTASGELTLVDVQLNLMPFRMPPDYRVVDVVNEPIPMPPRSEHRTVVVRKFYVVKPPAVETGEGGAPPPPEWLADRIREMAARLAAGPT